MRAGKYLRIIAAATDDSFQYPVLHETNSLMRLFVIIWSVGTVVFKRHGVVAWSLVQMTIKV